MRYLSGSEKSEAENFLKEAALLASKSTCHRNKCGSIIISSGVIIGEGFNSPPGNLKSQCKCLVDKSLFHEKVTDKTCCVHAEQRAIFQALAKNPKEIQGSKLYFSRLDSSGDLTPAGNPYCTICSKSALDVGIGEFILLHDQGICAYNTEEYNLLSYSFEN